MPKRARKQKPRIASPGRSAAEPSRDLLFIGGIAIPLLAAAILANLPAPGHQEWSRCILQVLIWLATVVILLSAARSPMVGAPGRGAVTPRAAGGLGRALLFPARRNRTMLIALGLVALFAVASYYRFGRFRRDGSFVHHHEFYHYYMGSKYFPELGYDGLYAATHRALLDNDAALSDAIGVVKNLRTYRLESPAVSLERATGVVRSFSDARWQAFKRDVAFFQTRISPEGWQFLLVDHGYNATPFWNLLGCLFSSHLPLSDGTLGLLAALDLLLIAGMLAGVAWAFDLKTALLFAIFFFANFFATFDFTGGGFLRQLWLAALVGFVCCFQKRHMIAAGVCLAVAVLDRAFPLVFLLLPALLFVRESWARRWSRRAYARVLASFALSVVLLGGLTMIRSGGVNAWASWYRNIRAHNQWFYINQISLRNLFVVNPATTRAVTAAGWDEALWQRERETLDARTRNTLRALRIVLGVFLIALLARKKEPGVGLALLSFAPFLLFYPANYYCIFLIVAILCWRQLFGLALAIQALQGLFWLLRIFLGAPTQLELLHWIVALCLSLTFVAFLAVALVRNVRGAPHFRRLCLPALAASTLLVAGSVVADARAARPDPDRVVADLSQRDVRSVRGGTAHTEYMYQWGTGWSRNDHVVCMAQAPAAQMTVAVRVRDEGRYTVRIAYSTAPAFGIVQLDVNGRPVGTPVNLLAPRLSIYTGVYEGAVLHAGTNDFTFTVVGKDPAATDHYFAIDTIVVERDRAAASGGTPAPAEARRAALDRAVAWVRAHPADRFDGGHNAICAEIVMLDQLASHPALAEKHAFYQAEIRERIDRLNVQPAYQATPDEFERLTAAAWSARRHDAHLVAFERVEDRVRQAASQVAADGSGLRALLLCSYLNRLDAANPVACNIEDSILHREYTERRLSSVLAGGMNRSAAPVVSRTLLAIAADVCALTDHAREPAPSLPVLADREFWAQLCEQGLRWGIESGDVVLVARLLVTARGLGVDPLVSSLPAAVDFLLRRQVPDGCFGVGDPHRPNPYRDAVLWGILALASSL